MPRTELLHNIVSLFLWHVSMHRADGEVSFLHLLSEPVHFPLRVTEDHSLSDCERIVEVTKSVEFPFFTFYCYKELLYTFQCQLVTKNKYENWLSIILQFYLVRSLF